MDVGDEAAEDLLSWEPVTPVEEDDDEIIGLHLWFHADGDAQPHSSLRMTNTGAARRCLKTGPICDFCHCRFRSDKGLKNHQIRLNTYHWQEAYCTVADTAYKASILGRGPHNIHGSSQVVYFNIPCS